MSKVIKILQCADCKREIRRQEKGDIKNSGILATNTIRYFIDASYCPECSGKEAAQHE